MLILLLVTAWTADGTAVVLEQLGDLVRFTKIVISSLLPLWSELTDWSALGHRVRPRRITYIANGLFCWAEYGEWFILLVGWIGWFRINGFRVPGWLGRPPDGAKPKLPLSSVKLCCDRSWLIVGAGGFWNGLLGTETDANGLLPTGVPSGREGRASFS